MKTVTKTYCIRENSCYVTSLVMFSYEYFFSNNIQNVVLVPPVTDYTQVSYVFPSDQIFTPEIRVTTKYKVM